MSLRIRDIAPKFPQLMKFLISGGCSATVNLGVLYLATEHFGIWYLYSTWIAFVGAFLVSFSLQKFWTFTDPSLTLLRTQLMSYFLVALGNLSLNTIAMYVLVDLFHVHYLIAQILTMGGLAMISYVIYQRYIFHRPHRESVTSVI